MAGAVFDAGRDGVMPAREGRNHIVRDDLDPIESAGGGLCVW